MDYNFTPEEEKYREEFEAWLLDWLPDDWDPDNQPSYHTNEEAKAAYKNFQKAVFDAGYATVHFPKEYGGKGKSVIEETIILQTIAKYCGTLRAVGTVTHAMATPTILAHGNEEQKTNLIPKILDGTHIWCQGFSEPDAGSDVANISTLAIREGDHYVVNGQKVWTSIGHLADYCMLVVRTDPDSKKHKGLSYLLVDMSLPGIDVRPMTQITGHAEFNEIFFDNAKIPANRLLGNEGEGWKMTITTLMFERVMGDVVMASNFEKTVNGLLAMAGQVKRAGKPVIEDPVIRQKLAQAYIEIQVLKYHGLRNFSGQVDRAGIPGPEGSIGKLLWSEPNQTLTETAIGIQGPAGTATEGPWSVSDGRWQYAFLRSKGNTIEAGTSEIQRNIIGERVLGLPKDSTRQKQS